MLPLKDNVPTMTFPAVTVGIIVVNAIVWIWEFTGTSVETDVIHYGYYPCQIVGPCLRTRLCRRTSRGTKMPSRPCSCTEAGSTSSSTCSSSGFGNNVEDALGRVRFLLWYIAGGLAATLVQTFVTLHWGSTQDASIPNIGASGAISAVLGAYFVLLPNARVLTAIFVILIFFQELPAVFFLGFWFLFQLWQGGFSIVQPEAGGGVAFFAHIGGFLFGALTVRFVAIRRPLNPRY